MKRPKLQNNLRAVKEKMEVLKRIIMKLKTRSKKVTGVGLPVINWGSGNLTNSVSVIFGKFTRISTHYFN
jgi:hypothetical protein